MDNSIEKKFKAIASLLEKGNRGSEWQEAGLLHVIEDIITDKVTDLSSTSLKCLMEEAARF